MIIIPTFWNISDCNEAGLKANPMAEALFLESTLVSRCFENTCMVVFTNAGGPVGKVTTGSYAGLSQVAVPFKGALGKLGAEEGMSVVEVDSTYLPLRLFFLSQTAPEESQGVLSVVHNMLFSRTDLGTPKQPVQLSKADVEFFHSANTRGRGEQLQG